MKKILLILVISFSLISYGKLINGKQLECKNGVLYEVDQNIPYTGEIIVYYENGHIKVDENFKDGKANGEVIIYNENEKLKSKQNYKDGKLNGESILYDKNGCIKFKSNFKDNKLNGEWVAYDKNGHIKFRQNYKDGEEIN